jgi:hypothetical protein
MRWRRFDLFPRAGGFRDQDPDVMADFELIYGYEAKWRKERDEGGGEDW